MATITGSDRKYSRRQASKVRPGRVVTEHRVWSGRIPRRDETGYLLATSANRSHLAASIAQFERGEARERKLR